MKIKILHISDLHYHEDLQNNKVLEAFFEDVSKFQVDSVFFTGDITNSGSKEEFDLFQKYFYSKLSEIFPKNRIIFCPGNHDVNRSLIKQSIGKPIREQLNTNDDLNQIIKEHESQQQYTTYRLKNYFDFLSSISDYYENFVEDLSTDYYNNYIFNLEGISIGVTSFNSTWLAEGGEKDRGKIAIGELNVENAYNGIKDCELKICLFHHPKEWLFHYDKSVERIKKIYDFAFNGHNHDPKPEINMTPDNKLVLTNTGCLYESDNYFNGYSILEISDEKLKFSFRTYFPKREKYDKSIDLFEEGTWITNRNDIPVLVKEKKLFSLFQQQAYNSILTIGDDSKGFKERFVFPKISSECLVKKDLIKSKSDKNLVTKEKLFEISDKLFIYGKQESGKTCLLYYIGEEMYLQKKLLPFYLNLENFSEKGADPFFREIRNIANDVEITNIESLLEQGQCAILLDDFKEKESKKIERLKSFIEKYPENKYIITTTQTALDSFSTTKNRELLNGFKAIYLDTFEVKHIRELVKITHPAIMRDEENAIVENICSSLSRTGLPYNPITISILLDINSQVGSFLPINKASLFDKLIEILLKKHDIQNISRGNFDFQNQIDLLSNFANELYLNEIEFSVVKFEEFVNGYMQQLGIEDITSRKIITPFIESNILVQNGNIIEFKIKSFQYFFFAKYLQLYPDEIENIKTDLKYLEVTDSIDFLTGLERKNIDLLNFVLQELDKFHNESHFEYEASGFDDFNMSEGLLTELFDKNNINEIGNITLPDSKKDELAQIKYPESYFDNLRNQDFTDPEMRFIKCLELSCNIIRNCELIKNIEIRENAVVKVIKYWASILVEIILSNNNEENYEELLKEFGVNIEEKEIKNFINVILPIAFQNIILENLGTAKLKTVIRNVLKKDKLLKVEKLLLLLLLEEIDESTNFQSLKDFINGNHKSYYIKEIIFTYLMVNYLGKPMPTPKKNKSITLMADIIAKKEGGGNKQQEENAKHIFTNNLKKMNFGNFYN